MFHIAIENTSIKDYFSEKLLDCFQSKTVPIYYGCTNIGDYFNTDGMFIVNSVEQIIGVCNRLTEDTYKAMLPAVEDNYNRLQKNWRIAATDDWCVHHDAQIEVAIRKILDNDQ